MTINKNRKKFFGRTLDEKTLTWSFEDDSGWLPEEARLDCERMLAYPEHGRALLILGMLFWWKERVKKMEETQLLEEKNKK